jgi:DNA-directed RNA polymerase beta' subunit
MSVKKIANPVAFDHMNNPMSGGLHDKALGVSPFD